MSNATPSNPDLPATRLLSRLARIDRWKWGLGILGLACVAQAILWAKWWEDPTHFKMSILFVWPAAIFALLIWWTFFSGWTWRVRLGLIGAMLLGMTAFFWNYRLEWDGDMVPRRIALRSLPTAEDIARQFLKNQSGTNHSADSPITEESPQAPPALVADEMDWTGFRGTNRDGVVHGVTIRQDWSTNPPREVWRHPIGRAWSSFAIVGAFAFTQEQRDGFECVVAYNFETGKQVWVHQDQALLSIVDANGGPGPHATPQFHEGMIYSVGGTGILNCLNASTGQRIWSTNILQLKPGHSDASETDLKPPQWGVSHSPLIVDDLVIVIPGGTLADHRGVAAYQKKTGDLVWSAGEHPASYGSPSVGTLQDTRQILVPNGNGLSGHAIDDGRELWFYRLENDPKVNSASPIVLDNQSLVFGTGYGVGTVRLDVTKSDNQWSTSKKWMTNRFRPKFNDFVLCDGFLYGLDDGTLCCVDLKNGASKWKSGRYGYGQVLLFDNQLLIISEDGELLLIPATSSKPEPIASKKILDSGFCWNHMAYSRGKVLIRNANEVVCLEIAESQ